MDEVKRFVGIDVAKMALDVFIGSDRIAFQWLMMRRGSGNYSGSSRRVTL